MEYKELITSKIYDYTNSLFTNNEKEPKLINKDILNIGNAISSVFGNIDSSIKIEIPRLVVVGTQSSGKSSLLNGLLSMDLLPTGKEIVTRAPLNLQLNQINSDEMSKVEFGNYYQGMWRIEKSIKITTPNPTQGEINKVRQEIINITNKIAGKEKSVTSDPINLQIYSPFIPNLSLVDLPGLTMVACTDKGQPKDIKEQIRNLVSSYIESKNTIILAVMQARSDLETDVGLDLIKEYDPEGDRTLGILTKVDLMNTDTDISDYLLNKVSKDLLFKYGYFAVKNKSKEHLTIQEALQEETEFFSNHSIYSKPECSGNITTPKLGGRLSDILIEHLKNCLPSVVSNLAQHQFSLETELAKIGTKIPLHAESKITYLHQLISNLSRNYIDSMENRTHSLSYGKKIKDIFEVFRDEIKNIQPFLVQNYKDQIILDAILNSEGNHMSFPIPPVEVLEKCIMDINTKPVQHMLKPSLLCSSNIQKLLMELIDILIGEMGINRFPNLTKDVKNILINNLLKECTKATNNKIKEALQIEENYVWTDDDDFLQKLYHISNNKEKEIELSIPNKPDLEYIRNILVSYYETIKKTIMNNIPKIVMTFLIKYTQQNINSCLFQHINTENIDLLLKEDEKTETKREDLINKLNTIQSAKSLLNSYL
jgi:dynamin 1-like protein